RDRPTGIRSNENSVVADGNPSCTAPTLPIAASLRSAGIPPGSRGVDYPDA
ncbi:hypothetical protein A2U01_0062501, partial [Trifolium medium]|nr:hypothetical protein [Trifolium medium]